MKMCSGCSVEKPLNEFYVSPRSRLGHSARCKPCHLARNRSNNEKRRTTKKCVHCDSSSSRLWYKGPKCEACYKVEIRTTPEYKEYYQRRNSDPEIKRRRDDLRLRRKYGISLETKEAMYASQEGLCGICEQPMATISAANVDHNHANGQVRALLCHHCNVSIGLLKEDKERFVKAIAYLDKFNGSN